MQLLGYIDSRVWDHFYPWLDFSGNLPVLKHTAGVVEPIMARQHFLFHTAIDVLCFCHVYPKWLGVQGNNIFTALGLHPTTEQLKILMERFPNARLIGVFDDDVCGRVLDCKINLFQMGRDASFRLVKSEIFFKYKDKTFRVSVDRFSLHHFRRLTGIRSTYRTMKPKGFVSFVSMLAHSLNEQLNQM